MHAEAVNGTNAGSGSSESFRYNAFISYRRTPRDTLVACEVQHSLEHFHLPAGIRKKSGKDRIERIFRDQEELEITADLSGRIVSALKSSEYLIVICSPEYSQSPWCLRELETFLRLRGPEHVLCVLSAGDPPAVFPDALLHRMHEATAEDGNTVMVEETVEPLAGDYRGSLRRARRTELPRLAAAMLGCSYDELVMRKERYRRRRLAAILTATAAAAALAITYLLWSNTQITRNYRQAQISESRLLASQSLEAFENQDRLKAMSDGIRALVGDDPDRPVTEEAQFALARSTYAYETPFLMLETWRVDLNNDITDFFISRDGKTLVCMDQTGEFYSYDLQTRKLLAQFRAAENTVPATPIEGTPGTLLCYAGGEVVCADFFSGEVLWHEPMQYGTLGAVALSPLGDLIAAADSYAVWVMSADQLPYAGLLLPAELDHYITELCWSADGSQIAVKLKQLWEDKYYIGVFTLETGAFHLLDCSYGTIDSFGFDQDGCLYVLGDDRIGESDSYNGTTKLIPITFELRVYRDAELFWSHRIGARTLADSPVIEVTEESAKRVFLALGNHVYLFDGQGVLTGLLELRRDVVKLMDITQDTFGFITDEGEQGTGWIASGISQMKKTFPDGIRRVETVPNRPGKECFAVFSSGNLCIYESVSDENVKLFRDDGFAFRPEGLLCSGERAVLLTDRTLLFYDLTAGEQTGRADLASGDAFALLTTIDHCAYLMRIHGDAGELSVLCFDLGSGTQISEVSLPVYDFFCSEGAQKAPYSHDEAMFLSSMYRAPSAIAVCGENLFAHDTLNSSIWRMNLPTGELTEIPVVLPEEAASFKLVYEERGFMKPSPLAVSPDGKLLFTAATDSETGKRTALLIRLADGVATLLPGTPQDLSSVSFPGSPSGSIDSVMYAGGHELYTCSVEGTILSETSWTGDNPVSFTEHDGKTYCVFPDGRLAVYQGREEIRSIPLTFNLQNAMVSGRDFRYVFTGDSLYLYCGAELNVIALDGDGTTPVYSAACVLEYRDENNTLLQFSTAGRQHSFALSGDSPETELFHLASVREYGPADFAARAQVQMEAFTPVQGG
ncbi:MAG: TIR domain-containing protein [Oscillospiraceae bacterium]|nr:TIR domain-containing protein [Oscillospiraceae bacterium]